MLVAALDLGYRRPVHPALMGKGTPADEGLVVGESDIGDLGDRAGKRGQVGNLAAPEGQKGQVGLEGQVGEDAYHVRVAAALAVAVDGGLDVADPGLDRGDRVRDCQFGVVVGVNTPDDGGSRRVGLQGDTRLADDPQQLVGQGAAVGVAQYQAAGPGRARRAQGRKRISRVGPVAIEVVLGIVDGPRDRAMPASRSTPRSCPGSRVGWPRAPR